MVIEIKVSNIESLPSNALRNIAGMFHAIANYSDSLAAPAAPIPTPVAEQPKVEESTPLATLPDTVLQPEQQPAAV